MVDEAYIVGALRTPIGTTRGAFTGIHPADLAAAALSELMKRTGVDPGAVEDVIMGCVNAMGPQSGCIARTAWLSAGLPEHVPGVTVDRQCGSSQQALHFAAQAIMSGSQDLVVAAGVENMAMVPIDINKAVLEHLGTTKYGPAWVRRYGDQEISQFRAAQLIAERWGQSSESLNAYALGSHRRALSATSEGRFNDQIVSVNGVDVDGGPAPIRQLKGWQRLSPFVMVGRSRRRWRVSCPLARERFWSHRNRH